MLHHLGPARPSPDRHRSAGRRTRRLSLASLALLAATALLASACSSGGDEAEAQPTTTTRRATTTTRRSTTTQESTTTTEPAPVLAPLTGLPLTDPSIAARPALVVKIDNAPQARPQSGLNQADIVYEELVESITRFAAVFHSNEADPVGPVRSARTTDIDLLTALNRPLFAWSGANNGVVRAVQRSELTDVGFDAASGAYWRSRDRRAPHNLYSSTPNLFALARSDSGPPPPVFLYRPEGVGPVGVPAAGVSMTYTGGLRVEYRWNPTLNGWARTQQGRPHVDAVGSQVAPENVVILFTQYGRSSADPRSPEARTIGEGEAWVLTAGHLIMGRWSRPDPHQPAKLVDSAGNEIGLTPGRTWVALPKPGEASVLPG